MASPAVWEDATRARYSGNAGDLERPRLVAGIMHMPRTAGRCPLSGDSDLSGVRGHGSGTPVWGLRWGFGRAVQSLSCVHRPGSLERP